MVMNKFTKYELHLTSECKVIDECSCCHGNKVSIATRSLINFYCPNEQIQVISHQVITGEQGKKYCETLAAPFERDDSEFSGGVPIEKTNIDSLDLTMSQSLHIMKT